jgi:hypothetical protein
MKSEEKSFLADTTLFILFDRCDIFLPNARLQRVLQHWTNGLFLPIALVMRL